MNTPAHLIFATAAFGRPGQRAVTTAAILGALAPDLSLYLMTAWSVFVRGIDPGVVFSSHYYSYSWQQVFAVDNSFILWGIGLGIALGAKRPAYVAFFGAGLLHLAFDFPVHNHDARMHFWPLTDWVFVSPISYWDNNFHGRIVGRIELAAVLLVAFSLLRKFQRIPARLLLLSGVAVEIAITGAFGLFF